MARMRIEAVAAAEHVELDVEDRQGAAERSLRDVSVSEGVAVDDVDRARADRVEGSVALRHDRGVFIDADAEQSSVLRYGGDQAADRPACGAVWVVDHVFRQPEPRRHMERVDELAAPGAVDAD